MLNKIMIGMVVTVIAIMFSACAENQNEVVQEETNEKNMEETNENVKKHEMDHSNMKHSSSGEIPKGLKLAENPTFPIGSKAIIQSDHMEGMKGAEATVVGAYNTIAYTVSFTPTTGGKKVVNHKWVIQEEVEGADEAPLEPGTIVKLNADHMEGMKGATATIETAEETTVYMVDFISTKGEQVTNHKWVIESELSAVE